MNQVIERVDGGETRQENARRREGMEVPVLNPDFVIPRLAVQKLLRKGASVEEIAGLQEVARYTAKGVSLGMLHEISKRIPAEVLKKIFDATLAEKHEEIAAGLRKLQRESREGDEGRGAQADRLARCVDRSGQEQEAPVVLVADSVAKTR